MISETKQIIQCDCDGLDCIVTVDYWQDAESPPILWLLFHERPLTLWSRIKRFFRRHDCVKEIVLTPDQARLLAEKLDEFSGLNGK